MGQMAGFFDSLFWYLLRWSFVFANIAFWIYMRRALSHYKRLQSDHEAAKKIAAIAAVVTFKEAHICVPLRPASEDDLAKIVNEISAEHAWGLTKIVQDWHQLRHDTLAKRANTN